MITPDDLAILFRVSSRTIYRWAEADRLHIIEPAIGSLWICPNSISQGGEAVDRQINSTQARPGGK
jgi:hypothetical protein